MQGTAESPPVLGSGEDGLLAAGNRAPAGRYVRTDVPTGRVLVLEREDWLPGSLDGHVAHYRRVPSLGTFQGIRAR